MIQPSVVFRWLGINRWLLVFNRRCAYDFHKGVMYMHKKLWNKDFILMLQGGAVSALGDVLYSVAIGYWVYEQTGSTALMGIMSSISMFMIMFVMPFSGTIIDKCNRKRVIVGMDILRGLVMLIVGVLAYREHLSVGVVLAAAVLSSGSMVFFEPAVSTVMLDIIPHDDMVRGQSVQNGVKTLLNLVGKAFSGALIVAAGVPLVILLNGVSYLISALTEVFISVPKTRNLDDPVTAKSVLRDFRIALDETVRNKYLRLFIPPALILNIFASGPFALMLPFVTEKGFSVEQYGYLMSVMTAASLICVVLLGIVKLGSKTRYRLMAAGYLLFIGLSVAAYLSASFWPVAVLVFLALFANTMANSIFNAALMLALPEDKRGALLGMVSAASSGGSALSAVIYGILCDVFPIHLVFAAGSLLTLPLLIYLCFHKDTKEFITTH